MSDVTRRKVIGAGAGAAAMLVTRPASARGTMTGPEAKLVDLAGKLVADGHSAGVSVGAGRPGRRPLVVARGSANLATGTAASQETVFRIASCTKQFTAAAVLLLAEQGKVALDAPIETLFAGYDGTAAASTRCCCTSPTGGSMSPCWPNG